MHAQITTYAKRVAALVAAVLVSLLVTNLLGEQVYPIGWVYLALFGVAGVFSFVASGTYLWVTAVWVGAMLVVVFGAADYPGDVLLSAIIIGVQYLSAVMTGGLFGQWLRYRYAKSTHQPLPVIPSLHALLISGVFLLLLPVLAFVMLAGVSIENESLAAILMFIPGNTPFLFPALLTAVLCGYWVKSEPGISATDEKWAWALIIMALLLLVVAAFLKFIFGFLIVTTATG